METNAPQEGLVQDMETSSSKNQADIGSVAPGIAIPQKAEEFLVDKIKETYVRLLMSGGQSTPIVYELGRQLLDLNEEIDAKTDKLFLKYCAAALPGIEQKALKEALLVTRSIDLKAAPDLGCVPVKKVVQLITLSGDQSVMELLEDRGIDAQSRISGNGNGIQKFEFEIDRLIDELKSQRAAAAPKKNEIIALAKSAERFSDKAEKALGDNPATTDEEIQQLGRMKERLGRLLETVKGAVESAEEALTSPNLPAN